MDGGLALNLENERENLAAYILSILGHNGFPSFLCEFSRVGLKNSVSLIFHMPSCLEETDFLSECSALYSGWFRLCIRIIVMKGSGKGKGIKNRTMSS